MPRTREGLGNPLRKEIDIKIRTPVRLAAGRPAARDTRVVNSGLTARSPNRWDRIAGGKYGAGDGENSSHSHYLALMGFTSFHCEQNIWPGSKLCRHSAFQYGCSFEHSLEKRERESCLCTLNCPCIKCSLDSPWKTVCKGSRQNPAGLQKSQSILAVSNCHKESKSYRRGKRRQEEDDMPTHKSR